MNVNDPTKESLIFLLSSKEEGSRALGPLRMGFSALNESSVTNPSSTVPSAFLEPNEGCYLVLTLAWKIKWSYNLQRSVTSHVQKNYKLCAFVPNPATASLHFFPVQTSEEYAWKLWGMVL